MAETIVEPIKDAQERAVACREITATLPNWFGIPEANARYASDALILDGFGARAECGLVGLLLHRPRSQPALDADALDIHWLGVLPNRHRQGVGARLVEAARVAAAQRGLVWMTVETLDPEVRDPHYLQSYAFYRRLDFEIVERFAAIPRNPMVRMARRLGL